MLNCPSADDYSGGSGRHYRAETAAALGDVRYRHSGCQIRTADVRHGGEAVRILKEAAQWLMDKGMSHWSLDEFQIADFETAAAAGELVIGFEGAEAAAVMLLQSTDAIYWPTELPGAALYIHKLAVRRASAGRCWSAHMVEWAAVEARARAIPRLRLDTLPGSRLQSLYESYGFMTVDSYPIRVVTATVIRMERRL